VHVCVHMCAREFVCVCVCVCMYARTHTLYVRYRAMGKRE